jgi:hypothetical protein
MVMPRGRPRGITPEFALASAGRLRQLGPEVLGLFGIEFNDQAPTTLEWNPHDDASALFGDLQRAITGPGFHGGHDSPFLIAELFPLFPKWAGFSRTRRICLS